MESIGNIIKGLRLEKKLTQKDISEGICTQAQISKIEKGEVLPLSSTLHQLSERLGTNIIYLLNMAMYKRFDYVMEVQSQMRKLVEKLQYKELYELVQKEKKSPLYKEIDKYRQFILWHEGMSEYKCFQHAESALSHLNKALEITNKSKKAFNNREIEILNSIGVIYFATGDYDSAVRVYEQILPILTEVDKESIEIKVRVYYNLAMTLTRKRKYKKSNDLCEGAIKLCQQSHNMYLLGELNYHMGYNYSLLSNYEKAITYYKNAMAMFELQADFKYMDIIREKMNEAFAKLKCNKEDRIATQ